MHDEDQHTRARTTANEPADGIDPGGTRSTRRHAKPDRVEQTVESGDRNALDREDPIRNDGRPPR